MMALNLVNQVHLVDEERSPVVIGAVVRSNLELSLARVMHCEMTALISLSVFMVAIMVVATLCGYDRFALIGQ